MSNESESNLQSQFKDQIDILNKINEYETKVEYNRFLLLTAFGSILCFIAGFLELIFNKFYNKDVIFFQYDFSNISTDLPLFIGVWIITLAPLITIVIFSTGSSGFVNWNRTYRIIGLISIFLFFIVEGIILTLGSQQGQ